MTPLAGLNISMIESFVFYDLDHIIIYMEISGFSEINYQILGTPNYHMMKSISGENKHHFYDFPTSLNHYKRATSNRPADTKFVLQPFTTENLHKTIQVFYTHTS